MRHAGLFPRAPCSPRRSMMKFPANSLIRRRHRFPPIVPSHVIASFLSRNCVHSSGNFPAFFPVIGAENSSLLTPSSATFLALTYYAFCVNIYAECVNRLSSVRFFQQSGKKSLRRQCFLPKRPGIFPNSQRISTLHLRAFRESSKL